MPTSAPVLETIEAEDGTPLVLYRWGEGSRTGTALLVHGLGEYAGRYGQVAERLGALGWDVVGYDHRGHGRSGGDRGKLRRDDDLIRDLAVVVDAVSSPSLLLLGHSMGGLVAARFVAEAVRPVHLLVLSSPALDAGLSAPQRLLVQVTRRLVPDLAVGNGLDPAGASRDPAEVRAYREDPLIHDRISPRLAGFVMEGGAEVLAVASTWSVPTLLLWAGDEQFVGPGGSAEFARLAPSSQVTAHRFPEHRHELFNDLDREVVFEALERWLRSRTPDVVAREGHGPYRGGPAPSS